MKVVDKTVEPRTRETWTDDIPVGQVFRGRIWGIRSRTYITGIFYKAYGPNTLVDVKNDQNKIHAQGGIIVRLDSTTMVPGFSNICLGVTTVKDYEPLDVELVIKGTL